MNHHFTEISFERTRGDAGPHLAAKRQDLLIIKDLQIAQQHTISCTIRLNNPLVQIPTKYIRQYRKLVLSFHSLD